MTVYPNPAGSELIISSEEFQANSTAEIIIYDLLGRPVISLNEHRETIIVDL
ncbi:T9SS type A sorting domain-containing protein [Parvicella tangerina]|uniref:T9SS type A sorting domain-containing protein n=1 Tax=Parvicella tangerina TaxID=2829795 RepID=UPI0035BFFA79